MSKGSVAVATSTEPVPAPTSARGAYGFAFEGAESAAALLTPADGWPVIEVVQTPASFGPAENHLDDDRAELVFGDGVGLSLDRLGRRAEFKTPVPLTEDELVHPFLAPVGSVFGWWWGREALHAGGFVAKDRVWAVVGDKGAGKSSTLAWLALAGHSIVCDDMLVVDSGMTYAGPRCLDLRAATAEYFGIGELLSAKGPRERWRLRLPAVTAELPIAGWLVLQWGDRPEAHPIAPAERIAMISHHRSLMVMPSNPEALLDLAALPAWNVTRPRSWDRLDATMARVLDIVNE